MYCQEQARTAEHDSRKRVEEGAVPKWINSLFPDLSEKIDQPLGRRRKIKSVRWAKPLTFYQEPGINQPYTKSERY